MSRTALLWTALLLPACRSGGDDETLPIAEPPPGGVQAPPAAPRAVAARPGRSRVDLAWDPVAGATAYHVESGLQAGGPYGWIGRDLPVPGFAHGGLQNGTPYYYRVYAANAFGVSGPSAEARAVPLLEPLGTVQFRAPALRASEREGSAMVLVSRTGGSGGAVSVAFTTASGTAISGLDFSGASGTLTWPSGTFGDQAVVIPIFERPGLQADRSFTVTLTSALGDVLLGAPSTATVTISD